MAFRFRRSIKILPGVRLNLGKRSASVSVGVRGAHVTLRPGCTTRTTVGIPGSGLSYTEGGGTAHKTDGEAPGEARPADVPTGNSGHAWLWAILLVGAAAGLVWWVVS